MEGCLDEQRLDDFVAGRVHSTLEVERHLGECNECREIVSTLVQMTPDVPSTAATEDSLPLIRRGTVIGRYAVVDVVGAGAMGTVYRAYDPELDRAVALKVLRQSLEDDDEGRVRLVREAQAMGRLSHPNVVPVHDVGAFGDTVFVAMALVDGVTLTAWLRERRHAWHETLALFLGAGEGLAAVHRAGLVHRDFKPDNVLVSGVRAQVTDFGLARFVTSVPCSALHPVGDTRARPIDVSHGDVPRGTPAYMAPELLAGHRADARSDQFSFCVALHEALFCERPFAAASARREELSHAELRVRAVLGRGLHADPTERFEDMEALLAALSNEPSRAWRRVGIGTLVLLGVSVMSFLLGTSLRERRNRCAQQPRTIVASVWGPERRRAIHEAFVASAMPEAERAWNRFAAHVDSYADAWRTQRQQLCEAAQAASPPAGLARWSRCLDQRFAEMQDLSAWTTTPTPRRLIESGAVFADHEELELCVPATTTGKIDEAVTEPAVDESILRRNVQARSTMADGNFAQALELSSALARELEHGSKVLLLENLLRTGRLQAQSHPVEALDTLERTLLVADELSDDIGRANSLNAMILASSKLGSSAERARGYRSAAEAEAVIARLGRPMSLEVKRLVNLAELYAEDGRTRDAERTYATALTVSSTKSASRVMRADAEYKMGILERELDHGDEAIVHLQRARAVRAELLGPWHAATILASLELGAALESVGRHADARTVLEPTLEGQRREAGVDSPRCVRVMMVLARAFFGDGMNDRAEALFREGLTIADRMLPHDDPRRIRTLVGLGEVERRTGRRAEAIETFEAAIASGSRRDTGTGEARADAEFALARTLGQYDSARARALAIDARDTFAAAGARRASELRTVRAWLAE